MAITLLLWPGTASLTLCSRVRVICGGGLTSGRRLRLDRACISIFLFCASGLGESGVIFLFLQGSFVKSAYLHGCMCVDVNFPSSIYICSVMDGRLSSRF